MREKEKPRKGIKRRGRGGDDGERKSGEQEGNEDRGKVTMERNLFGLWTNKPVRFLVVFPFPFFARFMRNEGEPYEYHCETVCIAQE